MAQAHCPRCQHGVAVPDCLSFGLLRCPSCQEAYRYQPASEPVEDPSAGLLASILAEPPREASREPIPEPTPPASTQGPAEVTPTATGPAMVAPHICQHCMCQIRTPISRKSASPNCPRCRNRTAIYALQFRCPHCRELLESPRRLGGQARPCPLCTRELMIPKLTLERVEDGADDLEAFVCECPGCSGRIVARRDEVGRPGICPLCQVIITVPAYGATPRKPAPMSPQTGRPGDTETRRPGDREAGRPGDN